ncbi:hypothetical protein QUF90_16845 [Desulfococcaceae bacterium HSG9]|nr:hypothetical protein [Desulfococcaceae bacterium HSG9]
MPYTAIKALLNPEIIQGLDTELGRVKLKESAAGTKLQPLWCWGLDEHSVVFRPDKLKTKSALLNPKHKGIHKGCDYIIITKYENRNAIIFCELKSNDHKGAKEQLYCSIPFIDYLISLLKIHFGEDIGGYERHFVIFSTARRLRIKRTSKKLKSESHKGIPVKLAGNPPKIHIKKILL